MSLFDSDDDEFAPQAGVAVETQQQLVDHLPQDDLEDELDEQKQNHDLIDEDLEEEDFGEQEALNDEVGKGEEEGNHDLEDQINEDLFEDEDLGEEVVETEKPQPTQDEFDELDEDDENNDRVQEENDEPEVVEFNKGDNDAEDVDRQPKKQKKNLGPPMNISVPLVNHPDPNKLKIVRFAQFVGVEPRVFDEENFNPTEELYTIIRWRWRADGEGGQQQKESNAKWIKWSDGSESLAIGDEVFDMQDQDISNQNMYLFARHHGLIQGVCCLKTRSRLQPVNMDMQTQKRLEQIMDLKGIRTSKVKTVTTLKDPETQQKQMEILEQQRIRQREQMESRRQKAQMRGSTGRKSGLNRQYLEEDDDGDYAGNNRSSFSRGARDAAAEARTESRLQRAKRDREDDHGDDRQAKSKRGVVLESSDDDDF
eukprot:TRINITY_DN22902_c1_g1_i2.p1 TRINITY_DN22902_c1_g1~~TRINITY_DN22902_c1_g1_i2.p1  ORF type:complete len:425 (-),score=98.28 TRINITY_DN22902_c1_g1_i2:167-1441(-)